MQQPCQSRQDLDVYLASPTGGRCPCSLAELALGSAAAKQAQTDPGGATGCQRCALAPAARLVQAAAPDTRLFRAAAAAGAEECPSSFVIEAMGEPDVWGTATW